MNGNELNVLDENLFALLRSTPGWFALYASKNKWKYPKHLKALDSALLQVVSGKIKRLIVNMPPRHGKSEFLSKYFPAWHLGAFPDKRIILVSYETKLAQSWGRKVRDLVAEFGKEVFDISLNKSSRAAGSFDIEGRAGGMVCVGASGPITGKGADILIIDDPIKNSADAHSINKRESIWEWHNSTAFTRLEPNGAVILIMTRWHEDDICGRLLDLENASLNEEIEKWHCITLPALAGIDDPLGRQPGEALWEERFSLNKLLKIKKQIGEYWFSALYQQTPSPPDSSIFKRSLFNYFKSDNGVYSLKNHSGGYEIRKAEVCRIYATIDIAIATKDSSDYTVALIFAITEKNEILILDVMRRKFDGTNHLKFIQDIYEKWNPLLIGIESVQYQTALTQTASSLGYPVKPLKPTTDKISRALAIEARMENGNVYFHENAHWLFDFETELLQFPNGRHDDQVDAFAYIAQLLEPITNLKPVSANIGSVKSRLAEEF